MRLKKNIGKVLLEKDYWKEQAIFRLEIIKDLEKQLRDNGIEPFSKTRKNEYGIG